MSVTSDGPSDDPSEPETVTVDRLILEARAKADDNDYETAFKICTAVLNSGQAQMSDVAEIAILFSLIGQTDASKSVSDHLIQTIQSNRDRAWNDAASLSEMGEYLVRFDSMDDGEALLKRSCELAPTEFRSVFPLFVLLCKTDRVDLAIEKVRPLLAEHPHPFAAIQPFITTLDHCECQAKAMELLAHLEPSATTDEDRTTIATLKAGLNNEDSSVDQRKLATKLFDSFAEEYDDRLAKLGNNGPSIIRDILTQLDLSQDNSRVIFDAGCGTGLCAPFLKPLAKTLIGVDLSVPMLERCRERGGHDLLARTDLAALDTWPDGTFDMIICADVLVYFGALDQVFGNFATRTNPDGWLIFTVEELSEEGEDHRFFASGRHKHSEAYLRRALDQAGFDPPVIVQHERLRNELGDPVLGIAMASQRKTTSATK